MAQTTHSTPAAVAPATGPQAADASGLRKAKPRSPSGRFAEVTPVRERANELVRAIGLKPIKGRSGPRVAY
ncbi:hypothetical protein ACEYYA_04580 [Paracoccus sp. p3-h83]|uniref:hypothetical protein n=1 Tax=Paracoccus sp. p3-h83 TaxID=3342805 RepID=UPI0035B9EE4D